MLGGVCGGHVDSLIRRNGQMIALGLLIILSIPVLVDSQTHGLTWGFTSGDKFYFKETHLSNISNTVSTLSLEYYLIAEDYLTIQDPLTFFPIDREATFYINGTPVMSGRLYFAIPIGNWDLLKDTYISSYSSYFDTIDIIDDENYWGFRTTNNLSYLSNLSYAEESQISIFSKTDGVLVSLLYESIHSFGVTRSTLVERVSPPLILNIPVLIAGGSVAFVGLLGVYFFRRLRSSANQESISDRHSS